MGRDMGAARTFVSPSSQLGHTAMRLFYVRDDLTLGSGV